MKLHTIQTDIEVSQTTDDSPQLVALSAGSKGKLIFPPRLPDVERTIQHIHTQDLPSLLAYLDHHVTQPTALHIYVDVTGRTITAVIDASQSHTQPGTCQHIVSYKLDFGPEFAPLYALVGKQLTQDAFLAYLDEWGSIFEQASQLSEVVANFRSVSITRVQKVTNLRNGTGRLSVTTDEATTEDVSLPPPEVTAHCSVFPSQSPSPIRVLIRYRPAQGQVGFTLLIPGLETLILQQIAQEERRLYTWLEANAWQEQALLCRAATPRLTTPRPAEVIDIEGHPLPSTLRLDTEHTH